MDTQVLIKIDWFHWLWPKLTLLFFENEPMNSGQEALNKSYEQYNIDIVQLVVYQRYGAGKKSVNLQRIPYIKEKSGMSQGLRMLHIKEKSGNFIEKFLKGKVCLHVSKLPLFTQKRMFQYEGCGTHTYGVDSHSMDFELECVFYVSRQFNPPHIFILG